MGLTSKQIYALVGLFLMIGGFAVIISSVAKNLSNTCPTGEHPDPKAKGGCRVKCDWDDHPDCRNCTHWDYDANKCVKCDPPQLPWNGSNCVGQKCNGHGQWDTDNQICRCTEPGKQGPPDYAPPATQPVTPGWKGDLCETPRNLCTDEYIATKLVADTFTRTVDNTDTKINMWFGETWKLPASVSGKDHDVCREVIQFPNDAKKKKLLCTGTSKECWDKSLSTALYGKDVKCRDVCAGYGVPTNTPNYAGCVCDCNTDNPLHKNAGKNCALDWGKCEGKCAAANKTCPKPGYMQPIQTCAFTCQGGGYTKNTCNDKDHIVGITAAQCAAKTPKGSGTCNIKNCWGGIACGGVPDTWKPGSGNMCNCVPPPKA